MHQILYGGILRQPQLAYSDLVQRVSDGTWRLAVSNAIQITGGEPPAFGPEDEFHPILTPAMEGARARQAALLRDIVPHPLRVEEFLPSWRTEVAVALARGMYEARDFAAMSVLADALNDADCDQPDILDHCRSDASHVRGCWVVDLVLGKT